jgi:hypothetical protein
MTLAAAKLRAAWIESGITGSEIEFTSPTPRPLTIQYNIFFKQLIVKLAQEI